MSSLDELVLLESIIDFSPAVVFRWLIQDNWPVEYVSRNIQEQLGYSRESILAGRPTWPSITHPDDVPRLEKEVAGFLVSGTSRWSQLYRVRRADGVYRWFRDWNLLLRDANGEPRAVQGVLMDVTQEHDEQEELARTRQALEKAMESVIAGFVPICMQCKAIKDEAGNWVPVEKFINRHNPVQFSHGYCPVCFKDAVRALDRHLDAGATKPD